MTDDLVPCGTYGAYQRHNKRKETPCAACRKANADYQRERRQASDGWRDRQNAAHRAVWRLKDAHPDEYHALYVEKMQRVLGRRPDAEVVRTP